MTSTLTELTAGMPIPYGGDRIAAVDAKLARAFRPGDALYVVQQTGALLHVPFDVRRAVTRQVDAAVGAFTALRAVPPDAIGAFFDEFASRLEEGWERIERANEADVARARGRGRSTTRLEVSGRVREEMTAGLRGWARRVGGEGPAALSRPVGRVSHDGWDVTEVTAPLGVVAFVFEGRPNVLADAAGVVATGNTAVLRIGGDALGTAEAIRDLALAPALRASGLPEGTIGIVPVRDRSAGWALFSDPRLALAVTRGTGRAVMELSAVARQAGVPVSAHGTGGAWLVADAAADAARFSGAVEHSLDRKVCNTLNVAVVVRERAAELVPVLLEAADRAAASRAGVGARARIHVAEGSQQWVGAGEFATSIAVRRAQGDVTEPRADVLAVDGLSREWEWEGTPELALLVVAGLDEAITAVNRWSPQFVASLISEDPVAQERFRQSVNAPFVGDGFTRWVDGQYALDEPELGLSNWQSGRLLARGGVLTGATMTTRRLFAHQGSGDQHR